jgi:hypothetical protein
MAQSLLLNGQNRFGIFRLPSIGEDHTIENLSAINAMPTGKLSVQCEFEMVIKPRCQTADSGVIFPNIRNTVYDSLWGVCLWGM